MAAAAQVDPSLPLGISKFGSKLLQTLVAKNDGRSNIFISPYSISVALGMATTGAAGNTAKELLAGLEIPTLENSIPTAYGALIRKIETLSGTDQKLKSANAVVIHHDFQVKKEFQKALVDHFKYEFRALLESSTDKAALIQKVNKFAEEQTEGKIKNLLKEDKSDIVMVLVNAVYFKAKFEHEFNPNFTRPTPFFLLDGTSVNCQMMSLTKDIGYQDCKVFQAVKFHYKDLATNLQIFLPTEKGPKAMTERADFSNMTPGSVFISKVIHKTFLDVNEEGTEAAAATAVEVEYGCLPPEPVFTMTVDRPFILVIHNDTLNTILFIGAIYQPTEATGNSVDVSFDTGYQ